MPAEFEHQCLLFQWARNLEPRFPSLKLLHAIPNGGVRNIVVARKLKAAGTRAGVPDICLPVAPKGLSFHGLYIELKRPEKGTVSKAQQWWLDRLLEQGYRAVVCKGWIEAAHEIAYYLDIPVIYWPRRAADLKVVR